MGHLEHVNNYKGNCFHNLKSVELNRLPLTYFTP